MQLKIVASNPQASTTVEAAIDNFKMLNTVSTNHSTVNNATIKAQPNPFTTICYVQVENFADFSGKINECRVYNSIGQLVETQAISNNNSTLTLGENLPKGVYFLIFLADNQVLSHTKILKMFKGWLNLTTVNDGQATGAAIGVPNQRNCFSKCKHPS